MSESQIQNFSSKDPFADELHEGTGTKSSYVHIRIQQRNGRKTLTTVQGINSDYDLRKIVRSCKKEFACNGTVVNDPQYGEVIQFQGDQRNNVAQFLKKTGITSEEQIKVHGF